jgi:response regulator RpfG family c-di-GMP phosphodiesterase
MFRGRILIVSDRPELAGVLDAPIRAEGHLSLAVPSGDEAVQVLEDGIIPDIVISDGSDDGIWAVHFHRLNQLGRRVEIVTPENLRADGPAQVALMPVPEPFATISVPVDPTEVRRVVREAMEGIRRDLESLRGEMFRETARLQRAIRDAQVEMVAALVKIMETKDPFMQGHCERVAGLARRLAAHMNVEEAAVERLATAAMLHEIGKVGVSVELLHKTSALSPEELEQIRGHAAMGAQIVGSVPSLRSLAPMIAHQYTDFRDLGVSIPPGSEDHLLASILRVADVYDAMTSSRSYRGTLARERWEPLLREQAGSRLDPAVVEAFFEVILREAA